jgi:iron complex outermembrane receptor protein
MSYRPLARRIALGLFLLAPLARAQHGEPAAQRLDPVVVTGNVLRSAETIAPVSVLQGDDLVRQRGSTVAETLRGQGGVAATWFGPNSNRPVIRGLDGDRIRMLSNSGASLDASSLSFDHAVPIDPLVVERIEVLRGPAALQYGGNAIGGAVNAIDNRIPKRPQAGLLGAGEMRLGGATNERGASALLEAGNGAFAWHADAFGRNTSDLRVPRFTPIEDGTALRETDRVRNSASRTHGGALGGAATFANGFVGLAVDRHESRYGIVVEPDVTIDMLRDHVAAAGEWRDLGGPVRTLRAQLNHTRYRHEEVEGTGEIGTTFKTEGFEGRLEAEHAPIAGMRGVVGLQLDDADFSALGEEAFVPNTRTRRRAVFVVEELPWSLGTLGFGARIERAQVDSDGDADPAAPQFGPAVSRDFTPKSVSLSQTVKAGGGWAITGTLSRTERAPTSFELYAQGVHAATGAYERGDAALAAERGTQLDVSARWGERTDRVRLSAFAARYSGFIALDAT